MDYGIPAAPDGAAAPVTRHTPEFTGRAGEYFGIWFVNLILGIVTLGIYSAWAKVRTERYFYGHTKLAGASFDYLASPIAILKGRLIAYAFVIALGLSLRFMPLLYGLLIMVVGLTMPMIIVWGLPFHARNSAWRGLRFRFDETVEAGYGPFFGWPILQSITLSLMYPLAKRRQQEFVVEGHTYGNARFRFSGEAWAYYKPYLIALGLGIAALIGMVSSMGAMVAASAAARETGAAPDPTQQLLVMAPLMLFYVMFFGIGVFLRTRYNNLMWAHTRLEGHRFESSLRARDMLWIYASNGVAIVCSIGLLVPWAMVRLARYRAAHFALLAKGSLDAFEGRGGRDGSAVGEELVNALDIGVDVGF